MIKWTDVWYIVVLVSLPRSYIWFAWYFESLLSIFFGVDDACVILYVYNQFFTSRCLYLIRNWTFTHSTDVIPNANKIWGLSMQSSDSRVSTLLWPLYCFIRSAALLWFQSITSVLPNHLRSSKKLQIHSFCNFFYMPPAF